MRYIYPVQEAHHIDASHECEAIGAHMPVSARLQRLNTLMEKMPSGRTTLLDLRK